MFTSKNIFLNFKIINFKIKVTLKQKLKFCYQLTQIKHCRYRNVKLLLNIKHSQINKETNKKTKNIKANTSFNVIPCIHSPVIGLFLHISLATMTTFPCTSLIIKKMNWTEQTKNFPLVLCLPQTSQVQKLQIDSFSTNMPIK